MLGQTLKMPISQKQAKLNQELRDYAHSIDQVFYSFPINELRDSLQSSLSQYWIDSGSSQEILENLGIAHAFALSGRFEEKAIVCSVTDDRNQAESLLQKFSQSEYSQFRDDLQILSHWIFLVPEDYLFLCSRSEMTDWAGDFRCDGYPECWIIDEIS